MIRRSSLAALAATIAMAAPAAATPVGEPTPLPLGDSNVGLLYNPVDRVYVAWAYGAYVDFFGYRADTVPREGPITARELIAQNNPPFSEAVVAHDPDRDHYLVLAASGNPGLDGFIHSGDGYPLHPVTIPGAPAGAYAVVYNPTRGEFLIAFGGKDAQSRTRLYLERLDANGVPVGPATAASDPALTAIGSAKIAYRPRYDEYLVVWEGQGADGTSDIYAQRIDGEGREVGRDDIRVSGPPDGQANASPMVAQGGRRALVVWEHGGVIYGRRLAGRRARLASARHVYSSTGPIGVGNYPSYAPAVAFQRSAREFLVVWAGTVHRVWEGGYEAYVPVIFGQHVGSSGAPRGPRQFTVSPPDLPFPDTAGSPLVAAAPGAGYLATWSLTPGCCTRHSTIYARRVGVWGGL